jgi:ubiquinone/menaquinone biosynthesis C-methylase UbiE
MLDMFRALADPTRLRIVALLRTMELSVGELAQVLAQSQPRVSRHVKILCDAGIAERRKEGSWVFLVPGPAERTAPLFDAMDRWADADGMGHWAIADAARLTAVRADRTAAAERYFAHHAEEWDAIRALHVSDGAVEQAMARALSDEPVGRLADIGTGTGRMLELFAPAAATAIGIDRSPEMLRVARGKLAAAGLDTCELRLGDIMKLPLADASADTVILHQVLHYIPAPEAAIAEVARVLAPRGRLLVVDFAPHQIEELRSQDAHARLGFSDEQLGGWCASAGLDASLVAELSGAPLTVKLWRARRKPEARLKAVAA